ncbi:MAG: DUF2141 domain-containing protein [Lysobacterales bacterium]|jgi:uncharacterized protein (DUF2141 family)|nr:MAG: DUF2141 domain-containing protein [Xanthomonadales bacterium]
MAFSKTSRRRARAAAALLALLPVIGQAATGDESFDLTVRVVDADPVTGTLEISLFSSAEAFLKQPYLQTSGTVNEDGSHQALFAKLPPGEYAVVVVHDENGNGKLDTGFLGFGGESYAYSNDARPLFGRPSFDEVKFAVGSATRITISLE